MDELNGSAFYAGILVIMAVALALNTGFPKNGNKNSLRWR